MKHSRSIVVMGVSGCGKSTIAAALALALGQAFFDADGFHPPANVEKMRNGQALTDTDRWPWLAALNQKLRAQEQEGSPSVLACSALKQIYRDALSKDLPQLVFVHLQGSLELIAKRMAARQHEYMPASLLQSQFATLETPTDAITVSIDQPVEQIVAAILVRLENKTP
jgi:gluconokinase